MSKRPIIVVVALARSGTNLLRDIIAGTNDYVNCGEVFLPLKESSDTIRPFSFWQIMADEGIAPPGPQSADALSHVATYCRLAQLRAGERGLCVDIKHGHLYSLGEMEGVPVSIRGLADAGARFIHLRRKNILEQVASHSRALLTWEWVRNAWTIRKKPPQAVRLTLDSSTLMHKLEWHEASQKKFSEIMSAFAPLDLWYEDLLEDGRPSRLLRERLDQFLNIHVESDYKPEVMKIATPLDDLIENMGEVRQVLRGTRFEQFLPAPPSASAPNPAALSALSHVSERFARLVPIAGPGSGIIARMSAIPLDEGATGKDEDVQRFIPRDACPAGLYAVVLARGTSAASVQLAVEGSDGAHLDFRLPEPGLPPRQGFAGLFNAGDAGFAVLATASARLAPDAVSLYRLSPHRASLRGQSAVRPADIVVIGPQDSAAAALGRLLSGHDKVWQNPLRAVSFLSPFAGRQERFCRMLAQNHVLTRQASGLGLLVDYAFSPEADAAWYLRMFRSAPQGMRLLDVTPRYADFDEAEIAAFRHAAPAARILLVLQNPAELVLDSAWQKLLSKGTSHPSPSQLEEECLRAEVLARGDFRAILGRWEEVFGRQAVRAVFADDIAADPAAVLSEAETFLGLPPAAKCPSAATAQPGHQPWLVEVEYAPVRAKVNQLFLPQLGWLALNFGRHAEAWLHRAQSEAGAIA